MEQKSPGKKYSEIWYNSRGRTHFTPQEVSGNENQHLRSHEKLQK